jgi:hypothetical protein
MSVRSPRPMWGSEGSLGSSQTAPWFSPTKLALRGSPCRSASCRSHFCPSASAHPRSFESKPPLETCGLSLFLTLFCLQPEGQLAPSSPSDSGSSVSLRQLHRVTSQNLLGGGLCKCSRTTLIATFFALSFTAAAAMLSLGGTGRAGRGVASAMGWMTAVEDEG